ncbi:MAG: DUF58 domain-containing protein [Planctomycetales bacterium]|nr:DUF58 domain-containing protein [Planctomycetales bacterium]
MNEIAAWAKSWGADAGQLPFLLLILATAPLLLAAALTRTYPRRSLVLLLVIPFVATFSLLAFYDFVWLVVVLDAAVVLAALVDFFTFPTARAITVEREVMRIASLNQAHPVRLTIVNSSSRGCHVDLRDGTPQSFSASPDQFSLWLAPRSRSTVKYELQARRRGAFMLTELHLRVRSRMDLWSRYWTIPWMSTINVYPDMKQLAEYELLARSDRLSLLGVRRTRKIGQDNEFERLRDFTRDDNPRFIDWRATARRNKLTVKDFQASQSQRVIFMLDCGRMMTNQSSGLSLLDHALNSMLMLSYVALRRGDAVGLICFSDAVHSFVPPKHGLGHMNRLLHASFDRFPRLVESRYDQAFLHLAAHCRKRSLVVLVTNVIDEVNSLAIEQYLGNIVGRHLPLGVLVRDHRLFDAVEPPTLQGRSLYRAAVAAEILTWRRQILTDLSHKGVLSLDVFPEEMTAPMINAYLDAKARHLL